MPTVTRTELCPRRLNTTAMSVPAAIISDAAPCRRFAAYRGAGMTTGLGARSQLEMPVARHQARYVLNMRDCDVRVALHNRLRAEHATELDSTLLLDELGLCNQVRVDVAVLNGHLSGYELKSARDTLKRLPTQVDVYSQVLDYATLVVAENHVEEALYVVPPWWGLIVARQAGHTTELTQERPADYNLEVSPLAIAQLLWREEALEELQVRQADRGVRTKPRWAVWERLAATVDLPELRDVVRERIKARRGWRDGR